MELIERIVLTSGAMLTLTVLCCYMLSNHLHFLVKENFSFFFVHSGASVQERVINVTLLFKNCLLLLSFRDAVLQLWKP